MQNLNERSNPQDNKNLIVFIIISLLLWFGYDSYVLQPRIEAQKAAQVEAQQAEAQATSDPTFVDERPRHIVVEDSARISLDNDEIFGSLNLKGARIDDVSLHKFYRTIEKNKEIPILSPSGTPFPKYIESGWISVDDALNLPDAQTLWSVSGNRDLSPDNPVTLFWENGQGIRFEKFFSLDDRYLISLEQKIVNRRNASVIVSPYALISRHELPEDFEGRFIVHEGPIGYVNQELEERSYKKMKKEPRLTVQGETGWIGITEKYWLGAILPPQGQEATYRYAYTPAKHAKEKDRYQVDMVGQSEAVKPGESFSHKVDFFVGAKELRAFNDYENKLGIEHLDLAVDFGMFYFLTVPLFWVLHFFYGLVGNFGVAILMITLCLRALVFPLANTSYRSFAKLKKVSPQMYELRSKYNDDKQKLQEELVKLYQKEKVNPAAGCLPILIQIPIFFALFKVLSISIEMRHQPFVGWIQDLSAPDPTSLFNLFGLIPWSPPDFLMIGIWPCLMLVTMIFQRKMSPPPTDKMQAKMIAAMPFFMTFILAQFAAGLVIYWTFSNFLSVIQQYVIMKSMGVEPHLFKKDDGLQPVEKVESEETVEKEEESEQTVVKEITPPKPKKSKKKK